MRKPICKGLLRQLKLDRERVKVLMKLEQGDKVWEKPQEEEAEGI